jgi:hypothetical protein
MQSLCALCLKLIFDGVLRGVAFRRLILYQNARVVCGCNPTTWVRSESGKRGPEVLTSGPLEGSLNAFAPYFTILQLCKVSCGAITTTLRSEPRSTKPALQSPYTTV